MHAVLNKIMDLLCLPARWVSWLTLPLIGSIILVVIYAQMGRNTFISFDAPVWLFGRSIGVNTLYDVQWYIFALLVLFGGIWALRDNKHVSVDFLWLLMSPRQQLWLRLCGDLLFLVPFCAIIAWYGYSFTETAWRTAEASTHGGLNSRWLIKATIPISFAMLTLFGICRIILTALQLAGRAPLEDK